MRLKSTVFSLFALFALSAQAPVKKLESDKPIEITSDALEVQQEKNIAIFTGKVVAIQGDVRLKSDKMVVHYRQGAGRAETQQKDAVSKIDVTGNVFMTTPEETASGARGVYDVDKGEIHLFENVALTRLQNVLKGDTLVYNLNTGQSTVTSGGGKVVESDKPSGQRVRALFIPENKDKPQ